MSHKQYIAEMLTEKLQEATVYIFDPCEVRRLEKGKRISRRFAVDCKIFGQMLATIADEAARADTEELANAFIKQYDDFVLYKTYIASLRYWTTGRYISPLDNAFDKQMTYLQMFVQSDVYNRYLQIRQK